jgi:hypothetical protein
MPDDDLHMYGYGTAGIDPGVLAHLVEHRHARTANTALYGFVDGPREEDDD